jgi:GntR family transcriptional regulator
MVAEKLGCQPGDCILHVKRLRFIEERPVALHDAYLTQVQIDQAALEKSGSLYALLEKLGVHLLEAEEHLDAIAATPKLAGLLNLPKGAPLLQITRTTWDVQHRPIEFVWAIYPANFYRYTVRLHR